MKCCEKDEIDSKKKNYCCGSELGEGLESEVKMLLFALEKREISIPERRNISAFLYLSCSRDLFFHVLLYSSLYPTLYISALNVPVFVFRQLDHTVNSFLFFA